MVLVVVVVVMMMMMMTFVVIVAVVAGHARVEVVLEFHEQLLQHGQRSFVHHVMVCGKETSVPSVWIGLNRQKFISIQWTEARHKKHSLCKALIQKNVVNKEDM